jgi:hypothetical protein
VAASWAGGVHEFTIAAVDTLDAYQIHDTFNFLDEDLVDEIGIEKWFPQAVQKSLPARMWV